MFPRRFHAMIGRHSALVLVFLDLLLNVQSGVNTPSCFATTENAFIKILHWKQLKSESSRQICSINRRWCCALLPRQERQELNDRHLKREAVYESIKRKIRASSYQHGSQNLRSVFSEFDVDKNGVLQFGEFQRAIRQFGINGELLSDTEIAIILEEIGNKGSVNVDDFVKWLNAKSNQLAPLSNSLSLSQSVMWTYGESTFNDTSSAREQSSSAHESDVIRYIQDRKLPNGNAVGEFEALAPNSAQNYDFLCSLTGCGLEQLRAVVYFLSNEVGIPSNKMNSLATKAPEIFSIPESKLRAHLDHLFSIGVPLEKAAKIIVAFPHILSMAAERKQQVIDYLMQLGVPPEALSKCICTHPQVLGLSVDSKIRSTVQFLVSECGIPLAQIGQLISTFPAILGYSVQHNMRPKLEYFVGELKLPKDKIGRMILKFPQLLGLSLSANIKRSIGYLVDDLDIGFEDAVKIVQQHPQLLGLNVETNVKPKVAFLTRELGLDRLQLSKAVKGLPTLLSLSVEMNVRPKVRFLVEEGGYTLSDIVRSPQALVYSLEGRIKPRIVALAKAGIRLPLPSLLSSSDLAFYARYPLLPQ